MVQPVPLSGAGGGVYPDPQTDAGHCALSQTALAGDGYRTDHAGEKSVQRPVAGTLGVAERGFQAKVCVGH